MDYEKAYKEARERAAQVRLTKTKENVAAAEYIFPELVESEYEMVRKRIIEVVELYYGATDELEKGECLSWLEKQKEQKPVEKQDYSGLTDFERAIHRGFLCAGVENVPVTIIKETAKDCLNQIKPVVWSEEDEDMIQDIIASIDTNISASDFHEMEQWLKSLRPQPQWKPSEEQMFVLGRFLNFLHEIGSPDFGLMDSLLGQLKKFDMKAPDKIYIPDGANNIYHLDVKRSEHSVEYIRKDISDETIKTAEDHAYFAGKEKLREELLEWAKEKKEEFRYDNSSLAFHLMIDKLNNF